MRSIFRIGLFAIAIAFTFIVAGVIVACADRSVSKPEVAKSSGPKQVTLIEDKTCDCPTCRRVEKWIARLERVQDNADDRLENREEYQNKVNAINSGNLHRVKVTTFQEEQPKPKEEKAKDGQTVAALREDSCPTCHKFQDTGRRGLLGRR